MFLWQTTVAASAAQSPTTLIANINWAAPSWDLFIVIFFIVAAFIYGMSLGRDRLVVILVAIYMSLAVVNYAPFVRTIGTAEVGVENMFVLRIGAFIVAFILLFFFVSRSALLNTIARSGDAIGSFWQVMLFSLLQVGLLISIVVSFLPRDALEQLAPLTRQVFADDLAQFLWIIAPIVVMVFAPRGKDEEE